MKNKLYLIADAMKLKFSDIVLSRVDKNTKDYYAGSPWYLRNAAQ